MKKFRCSCGIESFESDLEEVPFTEVDYKQFDHLWSEATYELTNDQKMFCIDADNCQLDLELDYSGRFMYGALCPAVRVDHESEFVTTVGYKSDDMGKGRILYRP